MTDIDREMKRILAIGRRAHAPAPADARRVRVALAATLGAVGASTMVGTSAAATGVVTSTSLAKLAAIGLVVGSALGGSGLVAHHVITQPHQPTTKARLQQPATVPRLTARVENRPAADLPPTEAAPPAVTSDVPTPSPADRSPPTAVAPSTRPALAEEVYALRHAQAQLERAPELALRELDSLITRFPEGHLAEETAIVRILANCAAGRVEAARMAALRFAAEYPTSVHAARVRNSCIQDSSSHSQAASPETDLERRGQ